VTFDGTTAAIPLGTAVVIYDTQTPGVNQYVTYDAPSNSFLVHKAGKYIIDYSVISAGNWAMFGQLYDPADPPGVRAQAVSGPSVDASLKARFGGYVSEAKGVLDLVDGDAIQLVKYGRLLNHADVVFDNILLHVTAA
jgi:hypothetical protein